MTDERESRLEELTNGLGVELKPTQIYDLGLKHMSDKQILDAAKSQPTSIKYLETQRGKVDYQKIFELGIETYINQIKQEQATREYTQSFVKANHSTKRPLKFVLDEALASGVDTWDEFSKYISEQGYNIDVKSGNTIDIARPYYNESKWLEARTEGQYTVGLQGQIRQY